MRKIIITLCFLIISFLIIKNFISASIFKELLNYVSSNDSEKIVNQQIIFIDLDDNLLHVFNNKNLVKSYPIASGAINYPSPVGFWKVVDKSDWGKGFGGSWMGLNVPWGKFGIHGTINPASIGHNASHGCFRMLNYQAKELYNIVSIGTPVIVSKGPYGAIGKTNRVIIPGDRGSDVLTVQRVLKKFGFYKESLDGYYSEDMKKSVFAFQKSKGIKPHNEITETDLDLMGIFPFE